MLELGDLTPASEASSPIEREISLPQVPQQRLRRERRAGDRGHQFERVEAPAPFVDVPAQPAEQTRKIAAREVVLQAREVGQRPVPKLRGDHVAQTVARKIAE